MTAIAGRRTTRGVDPGGLAAVLVLVVGACAALSIDVVRTGFGIKGDESTYVAMALSAAYDGDLAFEARDLERFYQLYNTGPEGIFLKRGTTATYRFGEAFPFVHRDTRPDDRPDRLYFGKAFMASVVAAPFVRLAGTERLFTVSCGALRRDHLARIPVPRGPVAARACPRLHRRVFCGIDRAPVRDLAHFRGLPGGLCLRCLTSCGSTRR